MPDAPDVWLVSWRSGEGTRPLELVRRDSVVLTRGRLRETAAASVAAAACWLGTIDLAHATAQVQAQTLTPAFSYPGVRHLTFSLRMSAGETPERFGLRIETPRYGSKSRPEGSPIGPEREPGGLFLSDGPGSVRLNAVATATPLCSSRKRFHGYEPSTHFFRVDLPARSVTTLTVRYVTGGFAPWPDLSYAPSFVMSPGNDGSPSPERSVKPRNPSLSTTRTGVRIRLKTTPRSSPTPEHPIRTIARGRAVIVSGRTEPPLRGARLALKYSGPGGRVMRTLARVPVDAKGRFRFDGWRPRRRGGYEVWALYRRSVAFPEVLSDYSCENYFELR